MPYLWRIPDELPFEQIGAYDRAIGPPNELIFSEGKRVDVPMRPNPVVRFECQERELRRNDCTYMDDSIPIVNEPLREFLQEAAPQSCQFVEVDIFANEHKVAGYFILNVTTVAQCVDRNASRYSLVPGTDQIMAFTKLVLLGRCMGEWSLARDSSYLSYLMVGSELAAALRRYSGVEMVEPVSIIP